ncbi:MAG: hypothetical protein H6574_01805 [Lewinellaceae bacterium]|nr:hypothetical protein [Saprospiraceae bacterium]MCB9329793.1 hypothetical protein [Lewinellaceae bacterium]
MEKKNWWITRPTTLSRRTSLFTSSCILHLLVATVKNWRLLSSIILLFLPLLLQAQNEQPQAASSTAQYIPIPDTFPVVFSFSISPEETMPADDTLPDADFRMYDPARRPLIDWGTTGNIGAPGRPLLFQSEERRGFDAGFHGFDLYQLRPSELQFFQNPRSFTDLYFSQGRIQNDNLLRARFSRTFSGGLNFSLQYRTFNHAGQYRYQAVKHTSLAFGVWYPVNPRYEFFLVYARNTDKQQENGGVVPGTTFGSGQFSGPINAEIQLADQQALTRHANWSLHWTHHLKFTGIRDSSAGKRVLRASHTAELSRQTYKFSDPGSNPGRNIGSDSLYFDTFFVDKRGIRNFLEYYLLDNRFTLNTFKSKRPGKPSDELALGLRHKLFTLKQEPLQDSVISNLFLTSDIVFKPSDRFSVDAHGALGVLSNFGEYQVQGNLLLGLGIAGEFRASLLSQRYPAPWQFQRLYISKRLLWSNDFSKPVETTLSASYALPKIGFEVQGKTHLVNNYLYYDQNGIAAQTGSPLQVAQLILQENLRLWRFRFNNTVALQRANRDDVLRLPSWFTKNSVFYSGPLFKKRMQIELGVDFRLNGAFMADSYHPLTAQFYLQDSVEAKPYPWLDAFVSFKVKSFRFFVRYENLATFWDGQTAFYQTANYPQPFGSFRFGVAWRFLDENQAQPGASTPTDQSTNRPQGPGRTTF